MNPGDLVLIVDDNLLNAELLTYVLSDIGLTTRSACDAPAALAALREVRPRVILMDIRMPGMDGLTLTRQLKADPATSDIPIIAVTASAMRGDEEKAIEAGCDGFITKPIDTKLFPQQLEDIVGAAARAKANR